jgi:hypothetical protein
LHDQNTANALLSDGKTQSSDKQPVSSGKNETQLIPEKGLMMQKRLA